MEAVSLDVFRQTPYVYQFHATGQVYHAWYEIASVASGATLYLEMRQNGSNIVHVLDYGLKSNSTNIEMEVYRGASFTPGDVRMNWEPYNHRVTKAPTLELYQNPTGVNLSGAEQTFKVKGYGQAGGIFGGGVSFSDVASGVFLEELLAEDEDYIIEIQNNGSGQSKEFFFHLAWYESGN